MGKETMDMQFITPAVTRTQLRLSPIRKNCKKAVLSEGLSGDQLLLLNLPEVPFVSDMERLNRSCPLGLLDSDDEEDQEVEPFAADESTSSNTSSFLQPRTSEDSASKRSLLRTSLARMSSQGSTRMAFHQSFRIPKRENVAAAKLGEVADEKPIGALSKKNALRRQPSAQCA